MTTIHTIAGPKDTADLGATLSHEHLCSGFGGMDKTTIFDFDEAVRRAIEALDQAYEAGIRTVMLPKRNARDLDEVPADARAKLEFVLLDRVEDAVACAIGASPVPAAT